jgi:hypothetical protein
VSISLSHPEPSSTLFFQKHSSFLFDTLSSISGSHSFLQSTSISLKADFASNSQVSQSLSHPFSKTQSSPTAKMPISWTPELNNIVSLVQSQIEADQTLSSSSWPSCKPTPSPSTTEPLWTLGVSITQQFQVHEMAEQNPIKAKDLEAPTKRAISERMFRLKRQVQAEAQARGGSVPGSTPGTCSRPV